MKIAVVTLHYREANDVLRACLANVRDRMHAASALASHGRLVRMGDAVKNATIAGKGGTARDMQPYKPLS